MSLWVISDIHGYSQALDSVFSAAKPKKSDTVVFLGDYIDRGSNSKAVIDWLINMKKKGYNFITLRGNHEIMMLKARSDRQMMSNWLVYGGDETLDSYQVDSGHKWQEQIPKEHWSFLKQTLPYYETKNSIFVHAGLAPGVPLQQQNDENLYWLLQKSPKPHSSGKTVFCGHTSQMNGEIKNFGHTVLLDTFICGGKWLSCLNVETGDYWQANQNNEIRCKCL
jgi:serine/threonine protein phosphatase 1